MRLEGDGQVQVQARGIAGSPAAMDREDAESGRRKGRPGRKAARPARVLPAGEVAGGAELARGATGLACR